ncbi:MAG: hypothetical protein WKF37_25335 [Bryobacteraceae bacterium]
MNLVYPSPNGSMLDQLCPDLTKGQIDLKLVREAVERLPEFQAQATHTTITGVALQTKNTD